MHVSSTSPLDSLMAQLNRVRHALRVAVSDVPVDLRERRPGPDRWSVAEVVEHLAIVETRTGSLIAELAAGAPAAGDDPATTPADHIGAEARAGLLDRTRKLEAPPVIRPSGALDTDAALAMLERSRDALLASFAASSGRDLGAVHRPHPRFGALDGYQWAAFTAAHEERHTAQIREIAEQLAAGGAP